MLQLISQLDSQIFKTYKHDQIKHIKTVFKRNRGNWAYHKDISKCGLTTPQELINLTVKTVSDYFDLGLPSKFYEVQLMVDDYYRQTKRGYILGMANYTFSLI